jgi:hypothetical protein
VSKPASAITSDPALISINPLRSFAPLNTTVPTVLLVRVAVPPNTALTNPDSNPKLLAVKLPLCTAPAAKLERRHTLSRRAEVQHRSSPV